MQTQSITEKQRRMAERCVECFVCKRAREKQKGLAFWLVKKVESGLCPWCKAYEKVYNRKPHELIPDSAKTSSPND